MAAPANPTAPDQPIVGFIQTGLGQASPAALFTWFRPAPLPAPIEHYTLTLADPDKGNVVITTADAATAAVVHLAMLGSEVANQWDGDETMTIRAVNADGSSSGVSPGIPFIHGAGFLAQPIDNTQIAIADNVQATVMSDTSISLSWDFIATAPNPVVTNCTHWRIRYQFGESTIDIQDVPFHQTSVLIENLEPGRTYAFQVAGLYFAKDIFGKADAGAATPQELLSEFKPVVPVIATTTGSPGTITGPLSVEVPVGASAAATFESSMGPVLGWNLINGPDGISIEARALPGAPYLGDLTGAPIEEGIFDAIVCVRTRSGASESDHLVTRDVRIISYGETLLPWLHNDLSRYDIQLDILNRSARSFKFDFVNGVRLVRGDTVRVYFPIRNGKQLVSTTVTSLNVNARLVNNFASAPLVRFSAAGETIFATPIGNVPVKYIDLTPDNPILDTIFTALNRSPGPESAAREIQGELEVVLKLNGQSTRTFGPIKLTIAQDYDR